MAGTKNTAHVVLLEPVDVPKCMQDGEKFIKWDEVNLFAFVKYCIIVLYYNVNLCLYSPPRGMILYTHIFIKNLESDIDNLFVFVKLSLFIVMDVLLK